MSAHQAVLIHVNKTASILKGLSFVIAVKGLIRLAVSPVKVSFKSYVIDCGMHFCILVLKDINECASSSTNPCEQNCFNTEGSFFCNCSEGFNQTDRFTCEG